jgi:hypothetical protein
MKIATLSKEEMELIKKAEERTGLVLVAYEPVLIDDKKKRN